jgi:aminopeptidase N
VKDAIAKSIYLSDYQVSNFLIDRTDLSFELGDEVTVVRAKMAIRRNPQCQQNADRTLLLDGGIDLQLQSFSIDGRPLGDDDYRRDGETLAIFDFPEQALLESVVHIQPQLNTALNGLYQSREMYCTQCEAQGFRQITFYLDRPDHVRIHHRDCRRCATLSGALVEWKSNHARDFERWAAPSDMA